MEGRKHTHKLLAVGFLLAIVFAFSHAQLRDFPQKVLVKPDTSLAQRDSLAKASTDTTKIDSLKAVKSPSGIDSVVTYSSTDSVIYSLSTKTMFMYGKGNIRYKELGLKAEKIDVNWNTSTLDAQGVPDSTDTSKTGYRGLPDLIDGNETYRGMRVAYNFKTKKGKIGAGTTEMEDGYYRGEEIKRVSSDVLFISDGKYTTCDAEHPHYYFASPRMKMVVKEKIVARPMYLYVDDVPIFALPFGVFPTERGRRSGIIAPAYGESARGRYLVHLGYYWAINDYLDWKFYADGYTKGTWVLYSDLNYALRYNFSGGINASYAKKIGGERGDPSYENTKEFSVHWGHSQQIDPTMALIVDFTLASTSFYRNVSYNLNDFLRQEIRSNATLTKRWEGSPEHSLTLNVSRVQNLQAPSGQPEISDVLPSVGFSRAQSYPFRFGKRREAATDLAWYELISYSYGAQLLNTRTQFKADPTGFEKVDERRGILHSIPITAAPKVGYFTVAPLFNYTEKWYDHSIRRSLVTTYGVPDSAGRRDTINRLVDTDVKGFKAVRHFDLGIAASTKFYGVVQPNILGIKGIRHQVMPTLSYTYQPDFSKASYGYYGTYRDEFGDVQKYSFFEREVFGGAPAEERQAIGLRIGNVIEMKTAAGDTAENKFQLLNFDVSTGYNFARDSLRFDDINLGYRTQIGSLLNISGGSTFSLYKFELDPRRPQFGRRVNKFLVSETGQLAQMTGFSLSLSTSLSGEKKKSTAGPVRSADDSLRQRSKAQNLYDTPDPDFSIPWRMDLNWNFSQSQQDPRVKFRQSNIGALLSFNLTESWKITATTNYDVIAKQFAAPQIDVYRDLHCWRFTLHWEPIGANRNYRLEIRLKSPQLQDVKVTKQQSSRDVF